jgi:lysozyme
MSNFFPKADHWSCLIAKPQRQPPENLTQVSQFLADSVLPFLQRPQLAFAIATVGAALISPLVLAGAAAASESPSSWTLNNDASRQAPQLSYLPPLPAVPRAYALTPERRALLNTIRYAEGTWKNGHEVGYRVMFGGSLFHSFDRHPDRVNRTPGYASAAAGAYQFMPFTWSMVSRSLGLVGFHPENQDQAALFLIQRRGALHLADRGELTPELAARLAPEWASFPTLAGRSFYGQPVKRYAELRAFYEQNLAQLRNPVPQNVAWERVPIRQVSPTCQAGSLACQLDAVQNSSASPSTLSPQPNRR